MQTISVLTNVYTLTEEHPESIRILKELGFAPIANPVMRKTIGKKINLHQAAKIKQMDPDELVKQLSDKLNLPIEEVKVRDDIEDLSMEEVFKEELGFVPPGLMASKQLDSEFSSIIQTYHHRIWGEERSIPMKFKYLMGLSAAIASGDIDRAKLETRKAILYGATIEMLQETLEMMVWLEGAPTLRASVTPILSLAKKLIAKQEQKEE